MLLDIDKKNKDKIRHVYSCDNKQGFISTQDEYLRKKIKDVDFFKEKITYHFYSNGRFALHDLIIFFANKIEKANVIASSFNISEIAAQAFIAAIDKRIIHNINLILNIQKRNQFRKAYNLLANKIPVYCTKIHAKTALIFNETIKIGIISSGNFSSNNNIERGYIYNDNQIFNFDYNYLNGIIGKKAESC